MLCCLYVLNSFTNVSLQRLSLCNVDIRKQIRIQAIIFTSLYNTETSFGIHVQPFIMLKNSQSCAYFKTGLAFFNVSLSPSNIKFRELE